MAKEMLIIFVYDSEMLQKEDDDPANAILYFHPTWVSDQQKAALCGQLMGTVHCVKSVLQTPKIVALQSGKFFVKEYGRYLLAIGTDRNVADWLLEHRAKTVCSLLNFFHQDIQIMSKSYDDRFKLSSKLYQLFETYLKYLFLGGNIFSYSPSIKLPKSASNVFLEAMQILQYCQESQNVLGGTLLYHNKVVATQLGSAITKQIVLTDPYRIKCPAETPTVAFNLPLGVQLFYVYISNKDYYELNEEASKCRNLFLGRKKFSSKISTSKEPVISAMKRDQSIIFTSVPEEDSEQSVPNPRPIISRPKFLNLKNTTAFDDGKKTNTTTFDDGKKSVSSSVVNSGQTTVCSTPMTDLNKVVYLKPMLICHEPNGVEDNEKKDDHSQLISSPKIASSNFSNFKKCPSFHELQVQENINEMNRTKTICDPNYPIFKLDGTVVSQNFYEDFLVNHLDQLKCEINDEKEKKVSLFMNFDSNLVDTPVDCPLPAPPVVPNQRSKEHRKSLTLPLKSFNTDEKQLASPIRRQSTGVLLTPLMSKLSSFDDRTTSSGFCGTPSEYGKIFTPIAPKTKKTFADENALNKCVLFVCGQQDMVIALLLQEDVCSSNEVVSRLWEISTEYLGKLERQLQHCLETYPSGVTSDNEPYSYLHLDADWDTMHRGGPWGSAELGALTYFHRDFKNSANLTEILMRCCDGVIYGHQSGKSQVFYHQTAAVNAGLPPPSDPMSNVPLKAKRRLERDHSIILL